MTNLDQLNDHFQQAPDVASARQVLDRSTLQQLRDLADLNHLDTDHGRTVLTRALMADKFGE